MLGLQLGFLKAKSVSLHFPSPLLETQYITAMDVEDALDTMPARCKRNVSNPENFVILQALITDSMEYRFQLQSAADAAVQARINKMLAAATKVGAGTADISWQSDTSFSVTIKSQLTIAYKTAKVGVRPVAPKELVAMKRIAAAA